MEVSGQLNVLMMRGKMERRPLFGRQVHGKNIYICSVSTDDEPAGDEGCVCTLLISCVAHCM